MYCGNCGKEISAGSQFCGHCGAKQGTVVSEEKRYAEPTKICELHLIPKNIKAVLYIYLDEMAFTWAPFAAKEIVVKLMPGHHTLEATIYRKKSLSAGAKDIMEGLTGGVINYKRHEDSHSLYLCSGETAYREISMTVMNKVQIKEMEK